QRRYRQQGRDLSAGGPRGPPRDPVLRLCPDELGRPCDAGRGGDRDRGAPGRRGPADSRGRDRAARDGGPQPVLRRHAGRADHRDRDRGGGDRRAVRGRVDRGDRRGEGPLGTPSAARAHASSPGRARRGAARDRRRGARLMASVAATSRRARGLAIRTVTDRGELRAFLETDRLLAAYAICDLEDREFAKTRWGGAFEGPQMVAIALEYSGVTPQPLFVMGRPDGIEAILRDVIRPRAAYVAVLPSALHAVEATYRLDQGPQMVRMWVDRARFRPYPADVRRLLPADIGELNRLYQLGFASWLPSSSIADGVYFGIRLGGRLVAAAGTHVISREARLAVVGN